MAGLNIPGVTDKYNTSATVEKLMQIERIPLTREQNQLDEYKAQKDAWREINTSLTSLRDTTKSLYSFENPLTTNLQLQLTKTQLRQKQQEVRLYNHLKLTLFSQLHQIDF